MNRMKAKHSKGIINGLIRYGLLLVYKFAPLLSLFKLLKLLKGNYLVWFVYLLLCKRYQLESLKSRAINLEVGAFNGF